MSKYIEQLPDGTYETEIADMAQCDYMYNDVCCNDKSEHLADFPDEYDCKHCDLFEHEKGLTDG